MAQMKGAEAGERIKGPNTHIKYLLDKSSAEKLELGVQPIACVSICAHLSFVYIVYNYFMQSV